jgi:hypothetical protein
MNKKFNTSLGLVLTSAGFDPLAKTDGKFNLVTHFDAVRKRAKAGSLIERVTVPFFPNMQEGEDLEQAKLLFGQLFDRVEEVTAIIMVASNPRDRELRELVVEELSRGMIAADTCGATGLATTAFEGWFVSATAHEEPLSDAEFEAEVDYLSSIHAEAIKVSVDAGIELEELELEFLRDPEFKHVTNIRRAEMLATAGNEKLEEMDCSGFTIKVINDTSHAAVSGLSDKEQGKVIAELDEAGIMGSSHASAAGTRGYIATDNVSVRDGLRTTAKNSDILELDVELFQYDDPILETLRENVEDFGESTYEDIVTATAESFDNVVTILNELVDEGVLDPA